MWWILYLVLLVWYFLVLAISLLGAYKIWKISSFPIKLSKNSRVPGVTILRPLKGIDNELYQNLRSCFTQNMPFELIFCIATADDPARAVAERLISEFPDVDAKVMIGDDNYGPNPKINNLAKGYKAARYDLLWVLDSNVAVSPLTMIQAANIFDSNERIQLVHNLPTAVCTASGLGGNLEEMYLLTAHSKFYTGINEVGIAPCICGKSNFYHRSHLDKATGAAPGEGIRTFANYISEDQLIAQSLWNQGGRTQLVNQPVVQPLGVSNATMFTMRRIRWLRVRKFMVTAATLVEPTTESILAGILGCVAWAGLTGTSFSWILYLLHMTAWCCVDYWNFHNIIKFQEFGEFTLKASFTTPYSSPDPRLTGKRRPITNWVPVWLARELLCIPIWIVAMLFGSQVEWRNRPFRIRRDLVAEEIVR